MLKVSVRFPVVCPDCGVETLAAFSMAEVCAALLTNASLPLSTPCHGQVWNASPLEREQIRGYLAAVGPSLLRKAH
jgi:hypothetical protein